MEVTASELVLHYVVLSLLLLIGFYVRNRVKILQKLYIPAGIIGGLIGLILGPEVLGIIPFPESWIQAFKSYPTVLIIPIMAASGLGLSFPSIRAFITSVGRHFCYTVSFYWSQFVVASIVGIVFTSKTYLGFGLELPAGFSGGHGTAAVFGKTLQDLGANWWELGQGVAYISATVGLIFGITCGIVLINILVRKKETVLLKSTSNMFIENKKISEDPEKRPVVGKSITPVDVLDPIAYTFSLIAVPAGIGIVLRKIFVHYDVPGLNGVGDYAWGLVAAVILWNVISKNGYSWILDSDLKNRVNGTMVDYLVVSGILSLPVRETLQYAWPILILFIAGMIAAVLWVYLGKLMLSDYWVERSLMTFGQCTGVTSTGIMLLRILDPNFETPAVSGWAMSYALSFPIFLMYLSLAPAFIMKYGYLIFLLVSLVITIAAIVISFILPKSTT